MQQPLTFNLDQNPNGRGLRCDGEGLFLGSEALLSRDRQGNFDARPAGELQNAFGRVYGNDETNWESRIRSVKLVANALNKGEMARAMITAVLMRLPDPCSAVHIADANGALAKSGFNPDEPRDERGRWTSGGASDSAKDHVSAPDRSPSILTSTEPRAVGIQVADAAISDAINDPLVEAARRAAELASQRNTDATHSSAIPAGSAHEDFWQALGSRLSDRAKALLAQIGNAELLESRANVAVARAEANAIRDSLNAYGNYGMSPWFRSNGERVQVPVINTGSEASDAGALISHFLLEPNAPLARPAINADWIDPLIDLVSLGAEVAGPGLRLSSSLAEAPHVVAAPEGGILIGKSGYRSIGEFTEATTRKYQALYDEGYALTLDRAKRGLVSNDPLVIGSKTDLFARYGLRDWLRNAEGIDEGPGQIVQVNRRLYDPLGSGAYRVPDVHVPGTHTILDGSVQFKTSTMPQILDYQVFSRGAKVMIIRPSTAPEGLVAGSYGIVY